jgi:cation-transporting ATPase 13A3/4/5
MVEKESFLERVSENDIIWRSLPYNYSLALTGRAFNLLVSESEMKPLLNRVLLKAQIYARMAPEDKALLVSSLKEACQTEVGMCGDGANDCIALKTADVGVSLSESEASIAAPFTSRVQDISCIIILLREGRAALTTSFQCFKFMELYSMIQFITVTLLYINGGNLSDGQFLYIDLIILTPLAIFMGHTEPYKYLTPYMPSKSLLSLPVLTSIIGQVIIQLGF